MPAADPIEAPKFGTSGLRGLVVALTEDVVSRHVAGFVTACDAGETVLIGEDLRPSSPAIAEMAARAVAAAGAVPVRMGALPTPALALAARETDAGAIMVTGSHIPADRNGLKFYTRGGAEITKLHEAAIVDAAAGEMPGLPPEVAPGDPETTRAALDAYAARYLDAFGAEALSGLHLGLYAHSSVARDMLAGLLRAMGARVTELARSETFIPVDTEAVAHATRADLVTWAEEHGLDAILSTDGDADRPLLTDAAGRVIPGDILGALTARHLGAAHVVTPVTANTLIEDLGFDGVLRTRIGSPFVIAGMAELGGLSVVGFEPNGGFLLGFDAGGLKALLTRDAVLPMIVPLIAAKAADKDLAALVAALPPRVTAADRLQDVDRPRAADWIESLKDDPAARADFWDGTSVELDLTDGVRMIHPEGDIVHLRMSGNAAELRVYAEARGEDRAQALLATGLARARAALGG
ncbi:phosphomannomutase [Palleronia sp. LCG004]|uniref:phosphomannomutase n=1 Tax=Palleronia sp. LCG004 TaxID=3079304 RepID=UPI0029427DBC|nr:phosphomannomutase [Palleronia sp. LCG004]WOI58357.1 phosphomannomutase [Palleronia sp. LCG004]